MSQRKIKKPKLSKKPDKPEYITKTLYNKTIQNLKKFIALETRAKLFKWKERHIEEYYKKYCKSKGIPVHLYKRAIKKMEVDLQKMRTEQDLRMKKSC